MQVWLLTGLALLSAEGSASPLQIRVLDQPTRVEVAAQLPVDSPLPQGKLSAEVGEGWLQFGLVGSDGQISATLLGVHKRQGNLLTFTPTHPLGHDRLYRAELRWVGETRPIATQEYRTPPRPKTPPPVVERIFPTADVLPANHLKFYIHFSRPMREGREIFDRIRLLGPEGKEVGDPWRFTELWSEDNRRLTLWIHPGRVKRGINLREELGTVLQPDREYTLIVGAELEDAEGQRLCREVAKKFRTTAELRTRPDVAAWEIQPPRSGTMEAVIVRFDRPMDHALLDRTIRVRDEAGRDIKGTITVGDAERSWAFEPRASWKSALYRIDVDEVLEDLAGNTPARLFDVDLADPKPTVPTLRRWFRPVGGP